jgi:hypothetical protein
MDASAAIRRTGPEKTHPERVTGGGLAKLVTELDPGRKD